MATALSKSAGGRGLLSRLHAWWEGYDALEDEMLALGGGDTGMLDVEDNGASGSTARVWTPQRIQAVQMICGEGSSYPGGDRYVTGVIKPLGLNETMSALVYGAQLGLYARVIARETGTWVDGIEPDPILAAEATRLSMVNNLAKKAAIKQAGMADAGIKDGSRDAVIAVEALHRTSDLTAQMQFIARILKPGGQLFFIDFVRAGESAGSTPAIDLWKAHEPAPPEISTLAGLRKAMKKASLKIRVNADITDEYCQNLTQGLQTMAKRLIKQPPDSEIRNDLLREVHYWGRRLAVLQSGDVEVVRLMASLPKE